MSDSLEETLRKVIEDIDLSGDDEMVFVETRENGIEDYGEAGIQHLENLIRNNPDFQDSIEFGDDAYMHIYPDFAEKAEGLIEDKRQGKPNTLEAACATAKEASNRIAESRDAVDAPSIDPR